MAPRSSSTPLRPAAAAVILAILAAGCGAGSPGEAEPSIPLVRARNATSAPLLPTDALALPDFDFRMFQELRSQIVGTPLVVNIWASWCGPCRIEAPDLARASARYGDRIQFLGVDILDSRGAARDFMREFGWTYPSVFDPSGEIRDRLGIFGQPATLFYDATGELVQKWVGPIPADELGRGIEVLLGSTA